jgi:hypothetical protein
VLPYLLRIPPLLIKCGDSEQQVAQRKRTRQHGAVTAALATLWSLGLRTNRIRFRFLHPPRLAGDREQGPWRHLVGTRAVTAAWIAQAQLTVGTSLLFLHFHVGFASVRVFSMWGRFLLDPVSINVRR